MRARMASAIEPPRPAVQGWISPANRPNQVLVVATSQFEDLSRRISGLGYEVIEPQAGIPATGLVGAVIAAKDDPGLDLARALAIDHDVIIVSDDLGFDLRLRAARAGVRAVLPSQIDTVELSAWLADFSSRGKQAYTILIVDDDELSANAYGFALERDGMQAHVITDPTATIDAIARVAPDLVLMDMNMPGVDGLEVARVIRQSRQSLSLPIVFLSAERDYLKQQAARRIGGDDFISKPVDLGAFADQVRIRAERAIVLRQMMERDSLTGLLNHARFKDRLGAEVSRSARTGAPISICILDLDHFKRVNDAYGHQAGDRVIQTLAHSLRGTLRRTDVLARYGGEEFAVILLDTPAAEAAIVMEKLREAFGRIAFEAGGETFSVTLSAGIADLGRGQSGHDLIQAADQALYAAKRGGRDRVCLA